MDEVTLLIEGQTFKVRKDVLCEHSDYFRAMFSGSYVENGQTEISIDIVDVMSMKSILKYMENSLNLAECSINEIGQLAVITNFLQINKLLTHIEDTLYDRLSTSNWMETMAISEKLPSTKLKQIAAAFGLLEFNSMESEYITSIDELYWYLSHPYLKTESELDVFTFGFEWISQNNETADSLRTILCCLDVRRLTTNDLNEIKTLIRDYSDSPAARVVDCLYELSSTGHDLSPSVISDQKVVLCDMFTERIFNEVVSLVTNSKIRQSAIIPTMPVWTSLSNVSQAIDSPESLSHFMYTYTESDFNKWIEIPLRNILGWKVTAWGLTKLVLVGGKYYGNSEKSDEIFMKDVMVYDTLIKKWTSHGVELPSRENGEAVVLGNSLFIVGGKGINGELLHSAIVYDLKFKTVKEIADFPITEKYSEPPVLCVHDNVVYAGAYKDIYRFEDIDGSGRWVKVITSIVASSIKISSMVSYGGYIYCTLKYFHILLRFIPGVHKNLQTFTDLHNSAVAMCSTGNRLLAFTVANDVSETLTIEGYSANEQNTEVLWTQPEPLVRPHKYAGCCALVTTLPTLNSPVPDYHKQCFISI